MLEQVGMCTEDVKFFVWPDEGTFSLHFWSLSCAADLFFPIQAVTYFLLLLPVREIVLTFLMF